MPKARRPGEPLNLFLLLFLRFWIIIRQFCFREMSFATIKISHSKILFSSETSLPKGKMQGHDFFPLDCMTILRCCNEIRTLKFQLSASKKPRKIETRNARRWRHSTAMASFQYFFGGKYDLIQLHRQITHQNARNSFFTSNFYLKFLISI